MALTPPASPALPSLDRGRVARWRRDWDAVMARFVPGLVSFETALFAAVEAARGGAPASVLDLGGGPGVLAERMARRWPQAAVGLVDLDPVLLAMADIGAGDRVDVLDGDLAGPSWLVPASAHAPYDVVSVVMTAHYLHADQVRALYRDARDILAPGGLLVVADLMPDDGISSVMSAMAAVVDDAAATFAWEHWWREVARDGAFDYLMQRRAGLFATRWPAEFTPAVTWHLAAARACGFDEAGILWRCGRHAAVAAKA